MPVSINSIKHLMTGHDGNSSFCFPGKFIVSRGTSLQVICYITGNFEAGNSLNLAVTAVIGQHSRVTLRCYPTTL